MDPRTRYTYRTYQVIAILSLLALFFLNLGRSNDAPLIVQKAFQEKFSDAENVKKWTKKGPKIWQVSFTIDERHHFATFSKYGLWKKTNQQVYYSEIPLSVLKKLETDYSNYNLSEIYSAFTTEGNFYDIILRKKNEEVELAMNSNGTKI